MSRIVVGVDGSKGSEQALEWAAREAQYRQAELHVVSTWTYPATLGYGISVEAEEIAKGAIDVADMAEARVHELAPDVIVTTEVLEAQPALALVDASGEADLLVVGTRGMGGFRGLVLGSVSQHCAHHSKCPVVIVRPHRAEHEHHEGESTPHG